MSSGLDDVVAADTILSHVDGAAGRLVIRGHDLEELAGTASFEAVCGLLWEGFAPASLDEASIRSGLGEARLAAFARLDALLPATDDLAPIEALRLLLASLGDAETVPHHMLVTAAMPVFAAAILRRRASTAPVVPDSSLTQAGDFLRMVRGTPATPAEAAALDAYLVTVADHGLNASTFTARVIASTRAGLISSTIGALSALKGPLHGGAPGPVLDMLDEIGTEERIVPWLEAAIDRGDRLMGFGHRIYRVRDPRADVLKRVVATLKGREGKGSNRIRFAEAVEAAALAILAKRKPGRPLDTNVEFYTALTLEALGLPRESFTPVFAMGRIAGWAAHVLEQEATGRLIRPQSRYTGTLPAQPEAA